MTEKYILLMYYVHSYFETIRCQLNVSRLTTVDNFQDDAMNRHHVNQIMHHVRTQFDCELSPNQLKNGIDLFLKSFRKNKS